MSEQRVHFVLDTYNSPCLKGNTRDIPGDYLDHSDEIYSSGSEQKTPFNFLNFLKVFQFQKSIFVLLL